ncbi:MAG: hypothetical protein GTO55_09135, partial [Armatimonadetes bacterium]|nr:hypothetical protein [Armatimonadota bacterium]NIM24410.1 hypothetical protein [Armatimonadota bacterium]NIM68281.1 hypothetical protein [Armatimonadota bacterium]NIM76685.1 hypothetical protein [Armatimonadota bacterium]NIN06484.1 hypothetical protein [Armatimonadota bacterium]
MVRRRLIAGIAVILIVVALTFIVKAKREREFLAEHTVNLAVGAKVNLPEQRNPVLVESFDFDKRGDAEGWELRIPEGPERMWIADGVLHIRRDGAPRSRVQRSFNLSAADVNLIELHVRRPLRRFSLSWLLETGQWSPAFAASRAISAEEWRTISFPVGQSEYWRGHITALRVNFDTGSGIKVPAFQVDSIRLLRDENPSFMVRPKRVGYVIANERQWVIPMELPGKFSREVEIPKGARLSFSYGLSKETWQSHQAKVMLQVSA